MSATATTSTVSTPASVGKRRSPQAREWFFLRSSWASPLLILVLFGAPMYLGGALASAVPLWATLSLCALAISGVPTQPLRRDRLAIVLLLMIGMTVFQLLPLPPLLLHFLAPTNASLTTFTEYPLDPGAPERWRSLHLDPGNGRSNLHYFIGLLAAYLSAQQLTRRGYGSNLLASASLSTVWISMLALAHWFWSIDKVYGFYTPIEAHPPLVSPLLNPNHLAAFTGIGAVLSVGQAVAARSGPPRFLHICAALLCGVTCAMTLSRGGVVVAAGSLLLYGAAMGRLRPRSHEKDDSRPFTAALAVYAVFVVALSIGFEALQREYLHQSTTKLEFIGASYRVLPHHWLVGTGSGGVYAALSASQLLPAELTFDRVEHLPADILLSFGIPVGLAILLLGIRWIWSVRPPLRHASPLDVAVFCGLLGLFLHDLLDFSLWLGACGYLAAVLSGYLTGEQTYRREGATTVRGQWRIPVFVLVLFSALMGWYTSKGTLYQDRDAIRNETHATPPSVEELRARFRRHPADPYLALGGGVLAVHTQHPAALRFFNRALELAPHWSQPHLLLVSLLASRGLRDQALLEAQIAARSSPQAHAALGALLRRLAIPPEQLARCVPEGARGIALLRTIASQQPDALAARADAMLIERNASDSSVLIREAQRVLQRQELDRYRLINERLVREYPGLAVGYLGLAELEANSDPQRAISRLQNALTRLSSAERWSVLVKLGRFQATRGDVEPMRRTMAQLLDEAGSNIDVRIGALGTLGEYELLLHNDLAALNAFERADAMSHPEHRYVGQLLGIAERMGDLARMRGACVTLLDYGQPTQAQRTLCAQVERRTLTPPPSL